MRKRHFRLLLVIGVCIVLGIAFVTVFSYSDNAQKAMRAIFPIARLDLSPERYLVIHTGLDWEVNRTLYFQWREGFNTVVNDGCLIQTDLPDGTHDYAVVSADNGNIAGVIDRAQDSPLLFMCSIPSKQCWPCDGGSQSEWDLLFDKLKQENSGLKKPGGL